MAPFSLSILLDDVNNDKHYGMNWEAVCEYAEVEAGMGCSEQTLPKNSIKHLAFSMNYTRLAINSKIRGNIRSNKRSLDQLTDKKNDVVGVCLQFLGTKAFLDLNKNENSSFY